MGGFISTDPVSSVFNEVKETPRAANAPSIRVLTQDGVREYTDSTDIPETGLVRIGGMEVTIAQAREYGLLDKIDAKIAGERSDGLNAEDMEQRGYTEQASSGEVPPEVLAAQHALDEVQYHIGNNISEEATAALAIDIIDGDIDDETAQALLEKGIPIDRAEEIVTQVADQNYDAAHAELGQERMQWLTNMAAYDSELRGEIVQFVMGKARGQLRGATWNDVYRMATDRYARRNRR